MSPLIILRNGAITALLASDIETIDTPDVIARDNFGNALGGIRLSQHAVPTATNTGWNGPGNVCVIYGSYIPFDDETLDTLYPDHGTYVNEVARVTNDNLGAGYIVVEDAAATIREAAASDIGKR